MPPAARVYDSHTCPMVLPGTPPLPHLGGPILPPCCPTVLTLGSPQARMSDPCVCSGGPLDTIIRGSATVMAGSIPAARLGDNTAHGGVVVVGAPTVIIGDAGAGGSGGAAAGASPSDAGQRLAIANELVEPGGSGTEADAALVAQQLAQMPLSDLQTMRDEGVTVIACRGSITDHRTELRGVQPRGWPPGSTWDSVPGVANGSEVTIAVVGHGTEAGPHVPATGEGHGCAALVLHEAAHALDHVSDSDSNSSSADFTAARDADIDTLSPYERQAGAAGREETFAESYAGYHSDPEGYTRDHPNLGQYWANR